MIELTTEDVLLDDIISKICKDTFSIGNLSIRSKQLVLVMLVNFWPDRN